MLLNAIFAALNPPKADDVEAGESAEVLVEIRRAALEALSYLVAHFEVKQRIMTAGEPAGTSLKQLLDIVPAGDAEGTHWLGMATVISELTTSLLKKKEEKARDMELDAKVRCSIFFLLSFLSSLYFVVSLLMYSFLCLRALLLLLDSKHYDDFQKLVMQREEEKPDPDTPEMLVGRVAQLVQMGGARVLFRMSGTTSDRTREVVAKAYLQLAEMAPFRGFIVQQSGVPALTKIANKVLRCVPSDVSIAPPSRALLQSPLQDSVQDPLQNPLQYPFIPALSE